MEELMIRIDNVSKQYKLGQIGGTTLRDELQRARAKRRGEEDPTKKIGTKDYNKGETFMALDGVSFEVKKGERVGIIGHNGAGKSTLLKLISRVTAPTGGSIGLNGRVASMLEVGTGFHGELTGRENIYMNGAILGMTKKEIDAKMEDIIEFSEVRQFIDTPVKRYSSGMYVKLAFSVAAHLDSEIMIMDEVLAVGDMAFQKKCLGKMKEVSGSEGRTILYVSHNMNTIRTLCDKCIVLAHGKVIFNGATEEAISKYSSISITRTNYKDYSSVPNPHWLPNPRVRMKSIRIMDKDNNVFTNDEALVLKILWTKLIKTEDINLRIELWTTDEVPQASYLLFGLDKDRQNVSSNVFSLDISNLSPSIYNLKFVFFQKDEYGNNVDIGFARDFYIEIVASKFEEAIIWKPQKWGYIMQPSPRIISFSGENIE